YGAPLNSDDFCYWGGHIHLLSSLPSLPLMSLSWRLLFLTLIFRSAQRDWAIALPNGGDSGSCCQPIEMPGFTTIKKMIPDGAEARRRRVWRRYIGVCRKFGANSIDSCRKMAWRIGIATRSDCMSNFLVHVSG